MLWVFSCVRPLHEIDLNNRFPTDISRRLPHHSRRRPSACTDTNASDFTDVATVICHHENPPFLGFGPCAQAAGREPSVASIDAGDDLATTRQHLRRQCPLRPGVYGMIDASGDLFYVGKAKSLQKRLLSYFFSREEGTKAQRIAEQARQIVWEEAPHELAALLRELELIRRWLPRMNRRDRPRDRTLGFLCIGRAPAPYAYISARPPSRQRRVFGPLPINRRLRQAVRRLNDCFQLRDCPARTPLMFADQLELFAEDRSTACLRHAFRACLGPCAAACSTTIYDRKVRAAVAFLRGSDVSILTRLQQQMQSAAQQQRFEEAALVRDAWQDLSRLHGFLQRLRDGRRDLSFIYPLPGYGRRPAWYLIRHGQVVRVIAAPRTRRQGASGLQLVEETYFDRPTAGDSQPEDLNVLLLLCQWFRRRPDLLEATIAAEAAREHCRNLLDSVPKPHTSPTRQF